MSKTQKIILFIGVGLIGSSLIFLLINTLLKKDKNPNQNDVPNTNLFSLFDRPVNTNTNNDEPVLDTNEPVTDEGGVLGQSAPAKNYSLISEQPIINFIPVEKTVDQISFSPDKKIPDAKVKKFGVRYIKYDGIVYEQYPGEVEQRLSTTVTARLGEAFIFNDSVVYRYSREDMQTIETFIGTISKKEANLGTVVGDYLPKNVRSFSLNEKSGKFAGLISDESRQSAQIITGALGSVNRSTILKTTFTDWLLDWFDDNNLVLTSRASGKVSGSAYIVNTKDSSKTKITSGFGLTTKVLPFDAGVLISTVNENQYETNLYKDKKLGFFPIKTVADKCTAASRVVVVCATPVAPQGVLPDDWYKGEVNYNDSIISYAVETGTQKVLIGSNETSTSFDIDIIKPSSDGKLIYFRDKKTGLLYKSKTE
ncbi:MAG: hypothetical protein KBB86_00800 [Candidatus Pacebacteria bacterium]|nr:hypothetical protein [Candidatus Paceibacterota bacterium]